MDHFILGGDETCLLASDGTVRIIGDAEKRKHEKNGGNGRASITMYRTGSAAGATGPTSFLPPGIKRKTGFNDDFLTRNGCAPGSTIVMTKTGYMTEEAWLEMAEKTAAGIRSMPVIADNPDWWVIKIIDGFGPHTSSPAAMEIYAKHKIMLIKEEGDTSQVCQAYDQKVAKDDKSTMRSCLAFLRMSTTVANGYLDGWDLIHVGMAAVRELKSNSWVQSFDRVNLRPSTRVGFPAWCKRIESFLEGGTSFEEEEELDVYSLLPAFWRGMEPSDKKKAVAILGKHEGEWTVACVLELSKEVHVAMKDMHHLRVCLDAAAADKTHLDRVAAKGAVPVVLTGEGAVATASMVDVTRGLTSFQLVPRGPPSEAHPKGEALLKGADLLRHMAQFSRRRANPREPHLPSVHLNVEVTDVQASTILNPTAEDYSKAAIIRETAGEEAKTKLARRKLDAIGEVHSSCGIANDPVRIERLKKKLKLTDTLAQISALQAAEKQSKTSMAAAALIDKAPAALTKLKTRAHRSSSEATPAMALAALIDSVQHLTVDEIRALAFRFFNTPLSAGPKTAQVEQLRKLITEQPRVLASLDLPSSPGAPAPASVAASANAPAPAIAAASTPAPSFESAI